MKCKITLTANAGVIIKLEDMCILIDALHCEPTERFSTLSPEQVETVFKLLHSSPPDVMLVTHSHPDHYSRLLTERAKTEFPKMEIILPWRSECPTRSAVIGNTDISWLPLEHMPLSIVEDRTNYGFCIRCGESLIFTPGDADLHSPAVAESVAGMKPSLALLPFPWLTLPSAKNVYDSLAPEKTLLLHLPFDDSDRYNIAARRAVQMTDAELMNGFLQTAEFIL